MGNLLEPLRTLFRRVLEYKAIRQTDPQIKTFALPRLLLEPIIKKHYIQTSKAFLTFGPVL